MAWKEIYKSENEKEMTPINRTRVITSIRVCSLFY